MTGVMLYRASQTAKDILQTDPLMALVFKLALSLGSIKYAFCEFHIEMPYESFEKRAAAHARMAFFNIKF